MEQAPSGRQPTFSEPQKRTPSEERDPAFWNDMAHRDLDRAIQLQKLNLNVAKNVVLFIGDGMGVTTVTAGRILKGQLQGQPGEETVLAMDSLPHMGLAKTYNLDYQVPDSAGTATAYLSGVKAERGTVGVNCRVRNGVCATQKGNEVNSILVLANQAGKSTGVVSTTSLTDATVASTYAHSASRYWDTDANLPWEAVQNGCKDIAAQLVDSAPDIEVLLAGGRQNFLPQNIPDMEYPNRYGTRQDGRNLLEEWVTRKPGTAQFVWNMDEFNAIDSNKTDYLLGLFEPHHMKFSIDRELDSAGEPTLSNMTQKAIQILQKNSNGFFLLVEGGRIDHGHHANQAVRALHDTVAFDDAIQVAKDMLDMQDSLIIVTADHSHTFTFGGYPSRGNPIFGKTDYNFGFELLDRKPMTSLLYGNGPGYSLSGTREDITNIDTGSKDYKQQSAVPLAHETHGGEDVPVFAGGPMAHLVHGVHEQNYVAHVMKYAACLGEYRENCHTQREPRAARGGVAVRTWDFKTKIIVLILIVNLLPYSPIDSQNAMHNGKR
ncbi:PREDICTED: alkaline phosphatase-like [Branchiostoma belcheri]|uniref:Alkaline phosphatase n=1 Tax=Branchiostoma belcheri TaxID=7741 RepID=A0A6P4YA59_BRABE|nr:PREDICTED: alkaline phosphatase-like [Branchiostoma belcheri]